MATTTVSRSGQKPKAFGKRDLAGGDVLVYAEMFDVDLEVLGDSARRTRDFQLVRDDVHHGAGGSHSLGDADRNDRESRVDRFVGGDALEIGVHDAPRDGMGLDLAHERSLPLSCTVRERDDRITPGAMDQVFELARAQRKMLGDDAVPVKDGRHFAGRA